MTAEIRHIDAFLAVARLGNFTRAAAALHVSQPALTVQIRQFEQALGVRLFDRNNRRVALTQAGRDLVAPCERLSLDLASIMGHARDLAAHRRGLVTVAALPSIAASLLPRAIRALADQNEGLVVRVRDVTAAHVLDLVRSGEADVGIGSLIRPDPDVADDLLLTDRLAAFMPAGHVLAARRRLRLRDLADVPLVLTGRDSSVRQLVERAIAAERLAVRVVQEATYMSTAIGMVKAGLGVAILPESALEPDLRATIRVAAIHAPALTRRVSLLRRADRSLSPAAARLVDVLRGLVHPRRGGRRRT